MACFGVNEREDGCVMEVKKTRDGEKCDEGKEGNTVVGRGELCRGREGGVQGRCTMW